MMQVTAETIRSIILRELRVQDLPLNLSFADAGFSVSDLVRIQVRINKTYSRTVSKVLLIDTCYSLTDRFNAKQ